MKATLPTTIGLTILLTVGILGSIPTNIGELPHPLQVPSPSLTPFRKKEGCTMPNQSNVVKEQPSEELTAENVKNMSKRLDSDCDGISNWDDNCPYVYNPRQEDRNKNGRGNACERPASADMIIPGHGVGRLMLGASQSDALKVFGTSLADKFDDKRSSCHQLMLHWNDDKRGNRGIFVYLKDDKASLISVFTNRFRTVNGIKPGDSPDSLASSFPTLEAYKLVNSGSDVDGGKDLIYWVDLHDGIAFGLYYFPDLKRRMIKEIDVFPAGSTFQPEGCVEAPQEWQKISTFDLN